MPTAKKSAARSKPAINKVASPKVEMKKPAALKLSDADMPTSYSIHIYGYGETQLLDGSKNIKVANAGLKALQPFIEHLATRQQKGTKITLENTHVINVFGDSFVDFRSSNEKNKNQRFSWLSIDHKFIEKLKKNITDKK